ncbi:class I SAM-dependent methyltransferase [Marinimicrobium sp. C2-29]|uniref:class I SAM-dependent methyltransferase n=1 Tax=Marinimicrobium sp. C2-29 TaxID=3139825 RepID=UPI0031391B03
MPEATSTDLLVLCNRPDFRSEAAEAARILAAPLLLNIRPAELEQAPFALVYDEAGVSLCHTGRKVPGPVRVDFLAGALDYRRRFGGGKGQMIAKAVGVKAGVYPAVLDVTAGLGRDGFVLACLGCPVHWLERSPLVYRLLEDGLARARRHAAEGADSELEAILARLSLSEGDGREYLARLEGLEEPQRLGEEPQRLDEEPRRPDVVYLDPMFPERHKSADVKKEMQAFHRLVGRDEDAGELLALARSVARYRVVVKRPRKAPDLAGVAPSHRIEGKSSRFDVYARQKLPERLNAD